MIVLKIGGDIFEKGLSSKLSADIKTILEVDKLVIVHGGGEEVTKSQKNLGKSRLSLSLQAE